MLFREPPHLLHAAERFIQGLEATLLLPCEQISFRQTGVGVGQRQLRARCFPRVEPLPEYVDAVLYASLLGKH
jgi:hypothetical protein